MIKAELHKDFIMPLKSNRKVALSSTDKQLGCYQTLNTLAFTEATPSALQAAFLELRKFQPIALSTNRFAAQHEPVS